MKKPISAPRKRTSSAGNRSLRLGVWVVAIIGILGLAGLLYVNLTDDGLIAGLRQIAGLSRGHDNDVVYTEEELPPAGGIHYDTWQNCGIYEEPIESGRAVHSLEHGAVWITYSPDLAPSEIARLQNEVRGETYLLLSPFPGQRSPIVLTAWSVQLEVNNVDDSRIDDFINTYRLGPTTPERGAACTGGFGEPLS